MSLLKKIATIACAGILASTLSYNSWALPPEQNIMPKAENEKTEGTNLEKEIERYNPMFFTNLTEHYLLIGWDRNRDGKEDLYCEYGKMPTSNKNLFLLNMTDAVEDRDFDGAFILSHKATDTGYEKIRRIFLSGKNAILYTDENGDGKMDNEYEYSSNKTTPEGENIIFMLQEIRKNDKIAWKRINTEKPDAEAIAKEAARYRRMDLTQKTGKDPTLIWKMENPKREIICEYDEYPKGKNEYSYVLKKMKKNNWEGEDREYQKFNQKETEEPRNDGSGMVNWCVYLSRDDDGDGYDDTVYKYRIYSFEDENGIITLANLMLLEIQKDLDKNHKFEPYETVWVADDAKAFYPNP